MTDKQTSYLSGAIAALLGAVAGSALTYWLTVGETRRSEIITVYDQLVHNINDTATINDNLADIYRVIEPCLEKQTIEECWKNDYNNEVASSEASWNKLNLSIDFARHFLKNSASQQALNNIASITTSHNTEMTKLRRPCSNPETAKAMSAVFRQSANLLRASHREISTAVQYYIDN